jgi:N4-gp56 family major capsid protein
VFGDPIVQTAFDTSTSWYLNDLVTFRSFIDKRPVSQAMPGDVITLTINGQLPINTTELTETLDVDAQAMPAPRQVSITLREYGNAVTSTNKLTKLAFTQQVASDIGQEIATNLNESLDVIYRTVLDGATNKLWIGAAGALQLTDSVASTTAFTTNAGNAAVSLLRGRKAQARDGKNYIAHIHPDVAFDLRNAVGNANWVNPHQYVDTANIYAGEVGTFGGARYIENTRCLKVTSGVVQYNTYFLGREGLVEAVAEEPHTVIGPVTDKLARFRPVGWYGLLGVNRFRENALQIVRSSSSLSALVAAYDPKA